MNFLTIKDGDFLRIDYVGRVDGKIFDLTEESVAKKENMYNEKVKYGSVVIIVGAGHLLKGIDEALVGKKVGDKFTVDVPPEKSVRQEERKADKNNPREIIQGAGRKAIPRHAGQH